MKNRFLVILCVLPLFLHAQSAGCKKLLKDGKEALSQQAYDLALNHFLALRDCEAKHPDSANYWLRETFRCIQAEKTRADSACAQANNLARALDFYDEKFALIYRPQKGNETQKGFHFIDIKGNRILRLGEYQQATPFDPATGFAWVKREDTLRDYAASTVVHEYLIDTLGRRYRVAYSLQDLTPEISALVLNKWKTDTFPVEILQYPQIKVLMITGNAQAPCRFGELPASFCEKLPNLEVLHLNACGLTGISAQISTLRKLRVLDINDNPGITGLPDAIGDLPRLRQLYASQSGLTSLPPAIGRAKALEAIEIRYCDSLTGLPDAIGDLPRLRKLYISQGGLASLPQAIGGAKALEEIDVTYSHTLTSLPDAIGDLPNLRILDASGSGLASLTPAIGRAKTLEALHLDDCEHLTSLPDAIGDLPRLRTLEVSRSGLTALPSGIGRAKALEEIYLSDCEHLTRLPDAIGDLPRLRALDVSRGGLTALPSGIGRAKALETLNINVCHSLTSLPDAIGDLPNLRILHANRSGLTSLNPAIGRAKALEIIEISFCSSLTSLPDAIGDLPTLRILRAQESGLTSLSAAIGGARALEEINLNDCKRLTSLPDAIGDLPNLRKLYVKETGLTSLNPAIGRAKALEEIDISGCSMLTSLPDVIWSLPNLRKVNASGSGLASLNPAIGGAKALEIIDVSGCSLTHLPDAIGDLPNLRALAAGASGLTSLTPAIGRAKSLEILALYRCAGLTRLPDAIGDLPNLRRLSVSWEHLQAAPDPIFSFPVAKYLDYTAWVKACVDSGRLAWVDTIYHSIKDMPDLPDTEYGELSKQFVLAHHFQAAIWAGRRVADTKQSFSPLAIAYLYAGQYGNAYNLYAKYKSTDRRELLDGLDDVTATVKHPKPEEVASIRTFLQTLTFDSIEAQTTDYASEAWQCVQDSNMAGVRAIYAGIKDIPTLRVTNYGFLSDFFALAHEYEGAIWAGERNLRDWKGDVDFLSHLAICYLYNGQYEQACALYATFKNNKDDNGRTGKEAFLQALNAAAAQNDPPKKPGDIVRIRAFLAE